MPTPADEPTTDDRTTTNVGGDLIGGNQINAQGSQGYIGQASGPITQNFIRNDALAPPRVPACPQPNAARLFGRDAILAELVNRLIGGAEAAAISAVRGLPGVGKSDLLRAVGNDARITAYFRGGVLYAELGPAPDASQWLRRWIVALGSEPPRSDDAETLAGALRAALAPRRALLILDDVWDAGLRAAKLLRDCGSPDCRALASSRSQRIAQEVAKGAPPLALDVLEAVPALALRFRQPHTPPPAGNGGIWPAPYTQCLYEQGSTRVTNASPGVIDSLLSIPRHRRTFERSGATTAITTASQRRERIAHERF